jgi:hypothetical protein
LLLETSPLLVESIAAETSSLLVEQPCSSSPSRFNRLKICNGFDPIEDHVSRPRSRSWKITVLQRQDWLEAISWEVYKREEKTQKKKGAINPEKQSTQNTTQKKYRVKNGNINPKQSKKTKNKTEHKPKNI